MNDDDMYLGMLPLVRGHRREAYALIAHLPYVSIRQHMSAYVSIRTQAVASEKTKRIRGSLNAY